MILKSIQIENYLVAVNLQLAAEFFAVFGDKASKGGGCAACQQYLGFKQCDWSAAYLSADTEAAAFLVADASKVIFSSYDVLPADRTSSCDGTEKLGFCWLVSDGRLLLFEYHLVALKLHSAIE